MHGQDFIVNDLLHDWIDQQTKPLDLVASWESLCDTYDFLRFADELTDTTRLEEFKWIIQQMNCFLTRMRKQLISIRDHSAALSILKQNLTPSGKVTLENRKSLAYQKLRQRWVLMAIETISQMQQEELSELQKGSTDGWDEYGIE